MAHETKFSVGDQVVVIKGGKYDYMVVGVEGGRYRCARIGDENVIEVGPDDLTLSDTKLKRVMPERIKHQYYYSIQMGQHPNCDIHSFGCLDDFFVGDDLNYAQGNYFLTEGECQEAIANIKNILRRYEPCVKEGYLDCSKSDLFYFFWNGIGYTFDTISSQTQQKMIDIGNAFRVDDAVDAQKLIMQKSREYQNSRRNLMGNIEARGTLSNDLIFMEDEYDSGGHGFINKEEAENYAEMLRKLFAEHKQKKGF